jgi:hypothetical protein
VVIRIYLLFTWRLKVCISPGGNLPEDADTKAGPPDSRQQHDRTIQHTL